MTADPILVLSTSDLERKVKILKTLSRRFAVPLSFLGKTRESS
jgi:hypothetical protein